MNRYIQAPSFFVSNSNDKWVIDRFGLYEYDGISLEIPRGFVTNFASIPKGLRWLIPVNGKHRLAALLHDFLYSNCRYSRKECDRAFLAEMKTQNVRPIKRFAMYYIARAFGASCYRIY